MVSDLNVSHVGSVGLDVQSGEDVFHGLAPVLGGKQAVRPHHLVSRGILLEALKKRNQGEAAAAGKDGESRSSTTK